MRALLQASTFIVALSLGSWLALADCSFALAGEINGRVIGPDGKGIAQAVVFVQTLPDGVSPLAPLAAAQMDQVNEQFAPTLLPIPVGTEVSFPNQDQIHHHVYSFSRTKRFEIPLYRGEEVPPIVFDKVGVVKVGCNIHDWMAGFVLVVDTPYYTQTNEQGIAQFDLTNTGNYRVVIWHPQLDAKEYKFEQDIQVTSPAGRTSWQIQLPKAMLAIPLQESQDEFEYLEGYD